jgi:hypothetical protein
MAGHDVKSYKLAQIFGPERAVVGRSADGRI